MKTKSYKKYKANQNHNNNRRITMNNNKMTTADTKNYTINDIAAGQLPPEGLFALIDESIDSLSMQATLVRGILTSLDFSADAAQDIFNSYCGRSATFDDEVESMRRSDHPLIPQELIVRLLEKKPKEFALLPQYVMTKLRSIGWPEEEALEMMRAYTWTTPNFTRPPTEVLGPVVFWKTPVRMPEEFTIGVFEQCRFDAPDGEPRVVAMAPAMQEWDRRSYSDQEFPHLPQSSESSNNSLTEMHELVRQIARVRDFLSISGVTRDQIKEIIAKFTWSGPNNGVRTEAPMFGKPSVA